VGAILYAALATIFACTEVAAGAAKAGTASLANHLALAATFGMPAEEQAQLRRELAQHAWAAQSSDGADHLDEVAHPSDGSVDGRASGDPAHPGPGLAAEGEALDDHVDDSAESRAPSHDGLARDGAGTEFD